MRALTSKERNRAGAETLPVPWDADPALTGALREALRLLRKVDGRPTPGPEPLQAAALAQGILMRREWHRFAEAQALAHHFLADALLNAGRAEDAIPHFEAAIAADPGLAGRHAGYALALDVVGRCPEALRATEVAHALAPTWPYVRRIRTRILLRMDRYAQGFADWRSLYTTAESLVLTKGAWDGCGRPPLLIRPEGFGDVLQLVRYVPLLAARGSQVTLELPPTLMRLLTGFPGVARVVAWTGGAAPPPGHALVPTMSLPHMCGTRTLSDLPCAVPYIMPAATSTALAPTPAAGTLRIGFAWAARAEPLRTSRLIDWQPLWAVPRTQWFSFQAGPQADRARHFPWPANVFQALAPGGDWLDTAQRLAQVDLIITVDTALAHLAGAMGKPVWVLLSAPACWRWGLERPDCPWYPTMRLFRQPQPGRWAFDWRELMGQVRAALEQHVDAAEPAA